MLKVSRTEKVISLCLVFGYRRGTYHELQNDLFLCFSSCSKISIESAIAKSGLVCEKLKVCLKVTKSGKRREIVQYALKKSRFFLKI